MRRGLVLFSNDLRVRDNPALARAVAECDEVVPAFVLDDELLAGSCGAPNRVAFLLDSLRDLDASLRGRGAALVVRRGDVVEQAMRLAARHGADSIHLSGETSPYGVRRHARLRAACDEQRLELRCAGGGAVVEPGRLTPVGGDHYRVFTPYWRAWSAVPAAALQAAPRRIASPAGLSTLRLPSVRALAGATASASLPAGGEDAGRRRLSSWLASGLRGYDSRHDDLAAAATSQLSPYLHFGCLSARTVLERTRARPGWEPFARQLCWRDFHRQVLAARPDLPRRDYRPRGDRWRRSGADATAWRNGLTGYPIVDAGMRQLAAEGYMHNRARLIVASFLTKHLYLDWRLGAAHFAALLTDADVANNVGNWQWVAGTGNDTRPNRVLNPLRQARRFDPDGDYVRRYVPELAALDGAAVHEPWRLPARARRPLAYPRPIVSLGRAAEELRARRSSTQTR